MDADTFPWKLFGLDTDCPADTRDPARITYPLRDIMACVFMAKDARATTERACVAWVRVHRKKLGRMFAWPKGRYPHKDVFRTVFNDTAQNEMEKWSRVFHARLKPVRFAQTCRALVAMDGKWARRAGKSLAESDAVTILTAFEAGTGRVLGQVEVGKKTNEIPHAPDLIHSIDIQGKVISADALHCQKTLAATILECGGHYLLTVKDNQPTLRENIEVLLAEKATDPTQRSSAKTWNKGHGRVEFRAIDASAELNDYLGAQWPGVKQVFQITRDTRRGAKLTHETVFGISSLPMSEVSAGDLMGLVRAHWAIENALHWRLDMNEDEDHMSIKNRQGAANMARINRLVAVIHAHPGEHTTASSHRMFECASPEMSLRHLKRSVQPQWAA